MLKSKNTSESTEKAMISQPTEGLELDYIEDMYAEAEMYLKAHNYEVVDARNADMDVPEGCSGSIYLLSKVIEKMSKCDAIYFLQGWKKSKTCSVVHTVAKNFGLKIIYDN